MSTLKRTPLFDVHQRLGARLVEFGGWEMPVQYSGIVDEHLCVRRDAGLFDISHMGEVRVSGPAAAAFLNSVLTNDICKLTVGLGQYSLICNERGGVVDDLYVFRLDDSAFLLVINASRISHDLEWLNRQWAAFARRSEVEIEDLSAALAAVAAQGPRVVEFIGACLTGPATAGQPVEEPAGLKKNQIARFAFAGQPVWVSRTGYTGEDGFEVITPAETIGRLWDRLMAAGRASRLQPAGLGARDTLRTEACLPLYGHELDELTTPLEAGLGAFVALEKGDFTGRDRLINQKREGVAKKCVAFKMTEKSAPPRPQYALLSAEPEPQRIGVVTSGTLSPCLHTGIGLGYVPAALAKPGTPVRVEIRGRSYAAELAAKPIYRRA